MRSSSPKTPPRKINTRTRLSFQQWKQRLQLRAKPTAASEQPEQHTLLFLVFLISHSTGADLQSCLCLPVGFWESTFCFPVLHLFAKCADITLK